MRRLDHVVLHVRSKAVLRPKDRGQPHIIRGRQSIDDMAKAPVTDAWLQTMPTRRPRSRPDDRSTSEPSLTPMGDSRDTAFIVIEEPIPMS
jgi:hypothetical protein